MFRLWRWTFARFYIRSKRKWGGADVPHWSASGAAGIVIAFNVLAAIILTTWGLGGVPDLSRYKPHGAVFVVVVIWLVHWRYVVRGGADNLIRRLLKQSKARTRVEERRLWAYVVGSLALPLVLGGVIGKMEGRW